MQIRNLMFEKPSELSNLGKRQTGRFLRVFQSINIFRFSVFFLFMRFKKSFSVTFRVLNVSLTPKHVLHHQAQKIANLDLSELVTSDGLDLR